MGKFIMAEENQRVISGEDKIFGINKLAQEMAAKVGKEKVVNATVGSLLDDQGRLVVLPSVAEELKKLDPRDFAEYAPIAGLPAFLEAAKKAIFMDRRPACFVEAVATPGGTGAIHNAIQNYTKRGDIVLTSDWHWGPYGTITQELERKLDIYSLFSEDGLYNTEALGQKLEEVFTVQDRVLIILNTPSHNPTGYSLTSHDWDRLLTLLRKYTEKGDKKIILLVDVAYLDFAGDAKEARAFLPKLESLPENLLPLIAFSMSKSYTLYGMRSGSLICLSPNKAITDEFKLVNSFSNRGTWSNGTRSAMMILSNIFADESLLKKVLAERESALSVLLSRGAVFTEAIEEAGLSMCPYHCGFFAIALCDNPEAVAAEAMKDGVFAVPMGKGIRVSVASLSEEKCREVPKVLAEAVKRAAE
ncbi:aminotransferase class I/II-fold pyridoxal phosphate-dependent enzyme [Bacillota bacterium]